MTLPLRRRVAVVDDEALARRGVCQLIRAHPDLDVIAQYAHGAEALDGLARAPVDLLVLDIQMPEMSGFEMVRQLAASSEARIPLIVFLTAYEEFALEAFDVDAVDYLVKPVIQERFDIAMERVRRRLSGGEPSGAPPARASLVVQTSRGKQVVPLDDILWIGADDYYAAIHTAQRRYLLRETMSSLETRLDRAAFVRVHRSAIVNLAAVRELSRGPGDIVVRLVDGTRLPVSRRRRAALAARFGG